MFPELRKHKVSPRSLAGTALGLLAAAMLIWLGYRLRLNLAADSLLELLVVLGVALKVGFREASIVSLAANLGLWYFVVPPVFSFAIADPQNWIALAVFEATALLVSRLSARAKAQAGNATRRQRELEQLYTLSQRLLLLDRTAAAAPQIVSLIQQVFPCKAVMLFDAPTGRFHCAGQYDAALEDKMREIYANERDAQEDQAHMWLRTLRLGGSTVGSLALCGRGITTLTASALASLSAIALESAHSFARESRAEAEKQTEKLRAAVLDALAHDFQTPLTAIRTASSAQLTLGELAGVHKELVSIVDREAAKLSNLTTRLLRMSRLDSDEVRLHADEFNVPNLIRGVLESLEPQLAGHAVRATGIEKTLTLQADSELTAIALTQLLDNAAKYSDPGSAITISLEQQADEIRILVHNFGPVIPVEQRARIFERFVRGAWQEQQVSGTGIGLSVTKKVMEAHGGRVFVKSEADRGNTFALAFPNRPASAGDERRQLELAT